MQYGLADCDEVEKLLRQQATLATFGELALCSENIDQILHEACRLVGEALGTDLAAVMELQDDGSSLLVRAGVGWNPGVVGHTSLKTEKGSSEGHALATGVPVISEDIRCEMRFKFADFLTDNGVVALVNVIIIGGPGKPPFGVLQVDSRAIRKFDQNDIPFLRTYANLLAAAIDRLQILSSDGLNSIRWRPARPAIVPSWRVFRN
ncbi:GAF domain-containing protein [Sphingomonas qilianensis]|uniref:GAF domain-containing protein n=1 Tax=Sphingomonas qilianensis TaxID=1736690 RepID=A0ABU9XRV1_9SPHN